jgi:hypothetical protein
VDGLTWRAYEADLKRNLEDLYSRLQRRAYRPLPSRRVYIPKPDGRQRPLAVAALEDKIVQRATRAVLNAIYEEDFLGFSYGFRPVRGAHDAMDALVGGIESRNVNFILDADIRSFLKLLRLVESAEIRGCYSRQIVLRMLLRFPNVPMLLSTFSIADFVRQNATWGGL